MNPCFSQLQVAHVSASFVAGLASACVWILSVGWSFTLFWCFKLPTPPQTNIAMTKTPASAGNTSLKGPCFITMIVYQSAFVISRCHGKASQWLVHPGWLGLFFGDESPLKPSYIFILGDENQPTRIPIFPPTCHINIGVFFHVAPLRSPRQPMWWRLASWMLQALIRLQKVSFTLATPSFVSWLRRRADIKLLKSFHEDGHKIFKSLQQSVLRIWNW